MGGCGVVLYCWIENSLILFCYVSPSTKEDILFLSKFLLLLPIISCPCHNIVPISDTWMKLGIYIKHMKAECRIPKSSCYDLHVKGQGHFTKKLHESCPGHILYTISCIITIPCMQVRLGMVVCRVPLLGHYDLLFTVYCTSKEKSCPAYNFHTI